MRALRTYWGLIAAIYLVPVESLRGFTGLPLSNACALTDHTLTRSLPRVHGWVSSRCRAQNGSSRTDRAGGSGRGAGRGSYQPNKTTNFGALSTYKICASEWAADALAAWRGGGPGVLFARGGDAGCARGRGGPLGGGRTLPIAAPVGKFCVSRLKIEFFSSLALIFGVKNTLACAARST